MIHIVDYEKYCPLCAYENAPEGEDPCAQCLSEPVNQDSRKPICWKEKDK